MLRLFRQLQAHLFLLHPSSTCTSRFPTCNHFYHQQLIIIFSPKSLHTPTFKQDKSFTMSVSSLQSITGEDRIYSVNFFEVNILCKIKGAAATSGLPFRPRANLILTPNLAPCAVAAEEQDNKELRTCCAVKFDRRTLTISVDSKSSKPQRPTKLMNFLKTRQQVVD